MPQCNAGNYTSVSTLHDVQLSHRDEFSFFFFFFFWELCLVVTTRCTPGVRLPCATLMLLFPVLPTPDLGSTQPFYHWVLGTTSSSKLDKLFLLRRLRLRGAIPLLLIRPHVLRRIRHTDEFTFTFYVFCTKGR